VSSFHRSIIHVTVFTTCFSNEKVCFLPTQGIYRFVLTHKITNYVDLYKIILFVVVMETNSVLCYVVNEFLNAIR
jgi:hypothetical protein